MTSRQDYVDTILDHCDNPRNRRSIPSADIEGRGGNPDCGDIVVIYARLGEDERIVDASFEGDGCAISQAAAAMLTEALTNKTATEVAAMSFHDIIKQMGRDVVFSRTRCATLALSTAKAAAEAFTDDEHRVRM